MIKWFKDITEKDFDFVGGKGFNLAALYNAQINIPNGFVITSKAYEEYLEENELEIKIGEIIEDESELKIQSESIKDLFDEDRVSVELRKKLMNELSSEKEKSYAVRSSSTVEDLPGISFAGQYSSFLNVKKDEIVHYMVECWKSLWNERAIDYRKQKSVTSNFTHCVIVQEMVQAKVSGVAFTANPVTGIRNQIFVNASFGLGEAIVSGIVNPDQYTIDKDNGDLVKSDIMIKEKQCVYEQAGIKTVEVNALIKEKPALNDGQLEKLWEAAKDIENYFGRPQDIEFSFDESGDLFILQSREITTLFPIDQLEQDGKLRMYMTASTVLLGMKEALTPLGADLYGGMFPKVLTVMANLKEPLSDDFVKYEGGRILLDISYMMSSKFVSKQFAKAFSGNDLPLSAVFEQVINEHGYRLRHQGIKFKIPWGMMKYSLSLVSKMKEARKVPKDLRYDAVKRLGAQFLSERVEKSKNLKTIEEKWAYCEETMLEVFKLTQVQAVYCTEVGNYGRIEKSIKKMFGDRFNLDVLGYALPDCYTVEMGQKLNEISEYLAENNVVLSIEDPKVKEFIELYGVRAKVELDFGHRRWREEPEFILERIAEFMEDKEYEKNIQLHNSKRQEAENMVKEIAKALTDKKGKRAGIKMENMLNMYRTAAGMREYPKFNIVQSLDLMRRIFVEEGEIQVKKGCLEEAEDIFFLHKEELGDSGNWLELIKDRKATYEKEMKRNSVPRLVFNTGETIYSAKNISKDANVLQGYPLSSGVYEGRIRIVHDPSNNELEEGEIMVAESTNPAWTPLFMTAKGLISEYGGPLSHGGIVAREYGIPAVVGISSVRSVLKDGQLVRINGDTGTVELLEK